MRTLLATLILVAGLGVVLAANAAAHVTVSAPGATRGGGDQEITFRVPVESNSQTVELAVALPTDTPIASVLVRPIPGWTHTQQTTKLAKPIVTDDGTITTAVSEIDWKARPGMGLDPGEYGSFTILAGQLPDAPSLTFRALQTYANGTVVRWNQVAAPGSTDEPQNPAPVLDLAAPTAPAASDTSTSTALPTTLSIVAVVLAAGTAGFVLLSRRTGKQARQ